MSDAKGPITLITDLSERSNRWKALALTWRSVAISAMRPCSVCGDAALWFIPETGVYWCDSHKENAPTSVAAKATKVPWFNNMRHALELEKLLEASG